MVLWPSVVVLISQACRKHFLHGDWFSSMLALDGDWGPFLNHVQFRHMTGKLVMNSPGDRTASNI